CAGHCRGIYCYPVHAW
nr:immunoglobulin heavy chain junction region [Macaca mulatta]MOW32493.1 immunoglobulin heavy chain junction region [Macaca mulatta]MOW32680.1 immunoglobulin heavy chain junction region [Macaca mulatta]MOW32704.1 immunoglobulin heavy chain junction region [Macaca mulatta]MOW32940.1 immunoglobulin heavy chain junction region [Macaca mulatta]